MKDEKKKWTKGRYIDESKIKQNSYVREYAQRIIGTRNNPKYMPKTVKFNGRCLLVQCYIKKQ